MYKYLSIFLLALICPLAMNAQEMDSLTLRLELPEGDSWKEISEGEILQIKLSARGGVDNNYTYSFSSIFEDMMRFDGSGIFIWPVDYDLLSDRESPLDVDINFEVQNLAGENDSVQVKIRVFNKELLPVHMGEMEIEFDQPLGWNLLNEGDTLDFKLNTSVNDRDLKGVSYYLEGAEDSGIEFDTTGHFRWRPSYDFVDRLSQSRDIHIVFIVQDSLGNSVSEKVVFTIFHNNRPPVIESLPIVYVIQGTNNVFQLPANRVMDPDGDPVVVIPDPSLLPEGATLNSKGQFSWKPSRLQFLQLLKEPERIEFMVEDQPYKARSKGVLIIEASKLDLPPAITSIPSDSIIEIREDQFININFYISDPNGDDDVSAFDFVSDLPGIDKETLIKNTDTQYEFVWTPGYDFVTDPDLSRTITFRFFAFDQSRNTTEEVIRVNVLETKNMQKLDMENYARYKDILVRTADLIDQLDENLKSLDKKLKRAKKGKKNRAIVSASFGAITGLSPLLLEDNPQKIVSGVGGTTVMTMGTLEARDAVGQSIDEAGTLIKTNVQIRNKLQNEGDGFARRYNSKLKRRDENFTFDLDKLKSNLNDPDIVKLELDATWENPKELTDRRIKQAFNDFKAQSN